MNHPFTFAAAFRRNFAAIAARENAALRIAAIAHDRLDFLLTEAERRQELHHDICRERGWPVQPTAGLDSVYEDVAAARL